MRYECTVGVVSFELLLIIPCRYLRTKTNRNMAHVEIRGRTNNENICLYLRILRGLFPTTKYSIKIRGIIIVSGIL